MRPYLLAFSGTWGAPFLWLLARKFSYAAAARRQGDPAPPAPSLCSTWGSCQRATHHSLQNCGKVMSGDCAAAPTLALAPALEGQTAPADSPRVGRRNAEAADPFWLHLLRHLNEISNAPRRDPSRDIGLACRAEPSIADLAPVKAGSGAWKPLLRHLGHSIAGAGWHARMSSRQR
jgi:hypothetical protein